MRRRYIYLRHTADICLRRAELGLSLGTSAFIILSGCKIGFHAKFCKHACHLCLVLLVTFFSPARHKERCAASLARVCALEAVFCKTRMHSPNALLCSEIGSIRVIWLISTEARRKIYVNGNEDLCEEALEMLERIPTDFQSDTVHCNGEI
jgi:hypothetical protein